jgi:hypothetical protein
MYSDNLGFKEIKIMKNKKKQFLLYAPIIGILLVLLAFCNCGVDYKQVRIPLNNKDGVPFYKDEMAFYVEGFEVDKEGGFYFCGGDTTTIVCYSKNVLKFRKTYTEFVNNQLYILNDKLYLFDNMSDRNNLFVLDKTSGKILTVYSHIINNKVNSYLFMDSSLVLMVFDNKKKIDMGTEVGYVEYTLSGKLIKEVGNSCNLPKVIFPKEVELKGTQYLGKWNNGFVFWDWDIDKDLYMFILRNNKGELVATENIDEKVFGKSFYGNPVEHKKLRNGSIFILGHDEKDAIITELPLKELFNQ